MLREDLVQLRLDQVGPCVVFALFEQIFFKFDGVTEVPDQDDDFVFSVDGDFMLSDADETAFAMGHLFFINFGSYHFFEESVVINLRGCEVRVVRRRGVLFHLYPE